MRKKQQSGSPGLPKRIQRFLRGLAYLVFLFLILLFSLELIYRNQWIDMYQTEFAHLNPTPAPTDNRPRLLLMGDSFSGSPDSYVKTLRNDRPGLLISNSAVPGTGILQANYMAARRFAEAKPEVFLYQIYVGNDLLDIRYPLNWSTAGWGRNLFWMMAERFRSLSWLNYKLAQRAALANSSYTGADSAEEFSSELYNSGERIRYQAEPGLLENSVELKGGREQDFLIFIAELERLLNHCRSPQCKVCLLVLPHAAQVHHRYLNDLHALGATFSNEEAFLADNYRFLALLTQHFSGRQNVKILNPLPRFRAREAAGEKLYFANDPHLNHRGQSSLAKFLEEEIPIP